MPPSCINQSPSGEVHLLMQKGPGHSVPPAVSPIEEGVEIGQQSVADGEVVPGGIQQQGVGSKGGRILGLEGKKLQWRCGCEQQKCVENSRLHSSQPGVSVREHLGPGLQMCPLISTVGHREITPPRKWPSCALQLRPLHVLCRGALLGHCPVNHSEAFHHLILIAKCAMWIKCTEGGWKPPQTGHFLECGSRNSSGCVTGHLDGAAKDLVVCQ